MPPGSSADYQDINTLLSITDNMMCGVAYAPSTSFITLNTFHALLINSDDLTICVTQIWIT